ncbi:TniQ family protein [Arthrobacter sp. R4]|uniref:TniQ family protein n=1 Tax=Arthrobacter sp. R4 TaxID=644417 RepID=UPI003ED91983
MRPPDRWPLHPEPIRGEAMTSWLGRIAACYSMNARNLLTSTAVGNGTSPPDLDLDPPRELLTELSLRTGVPSETLSRMNMAGWIPWLLDTLEPEEAAFNTYVNEFSIFLKPGVRPPRIVPGWRPWIPKIPYPRACPQCLDDPAREGLNLLWQLPLLLSCPDHGCLLEYCAGVPGEYFVWQTEDPLPRPASEAVREMDRRTGQAINDGSVALPRRTVHAGIWFRLLRTIIDELSCPLSLWGARKTAIESMWDACGEPARGGLAKWQALEELPRNKQGSLLTGAARVIQALQEGTLPGYGTSSDLFLPEPERLVDPETRPQPKTAAKLSGLELVKEALDRALEDARHNPETAQALFSFATHGRTDTATLDTLNQRMVDLGIPAEYLSHKLPGRPSTAHKISDG